VRHRVSTVPQQFDCFNILSFSLSLSFFFFFLFLQTFSDSICLFSVSAFFSSLARFVGVGVVFGAVIVII
jgi:hypothetical protein